MAKALKLDNVEVKAFEYIRTLWALTKMAAVVISPDSMMVHVAGMLKVPCISLWGPTAPITRMKYYEKQTTILHKEGCPTAPCHHSGAGFPKYCPPMENRKVCDAMMAITADEVVAACGDLKLVPDLKLALEATVEVLPVDDKADRDSHADQGNRPITRAGRPANAIPLPTA